MALTLSIPTGTSTPSSRPCDGGFIAAGSTDEFNDGYSSIWLLKTDSNGDILTCSDVNNNSATTGSIGVTVSNGHLSAVMSRTTSPTSSTA
jgi:hypothetical protein